MHPPIQKQLPSGQWVRIGFYRWPAKPGTDEQYFVYIGPTAEDPVAETLILTLSDIAELSKLFDVVVVAGMHGEAAP